ncbi:MalM family protein [Spartinivicinus ruber]|uniref:MalM family protein n=1 Tax=Spartinivicinus ruber TaxID=2683272 RepID=UPI0013D627FB|nr:MalM family protein [Spartinivicinus ruber]
MINKWLTVTAGLLALLLSYAGKASDNITLQQVSNAIAELKAQKSCCTTFASLPIKPLLVNQTTEVIINSHSVVFEFNSGKSYIAAFKLPDTQRSLQIKLFSKANQTVFEPSVMLLDSEFRITRILSTDDFIYRPAWGFKPDSIDGMFRVDRSQPGNPNNETYLVIFSTLAQMQGKTTLVHPAKAFAKAHYNQPPEIPDPIAWHSPVGNLELSVEEEERSFYEKRSYIPAFSFRQANQAVDQLETKQEVLPQTHQYFKEAVKNALNQGEVGKALSLVEEAERLGLKDIRQYFIERVVPKQ